MGAALYLYISQIPARDRYYAVDEEFTLDANFTWTVLTPPKCEIAQQFGRDSSECSINVQIRNATTYPLTPPSFSRMTKEGLSSTAQYQYSITLVAKGNRYDYSRSTLAADTIQPRQAVNFLLVFSAPADIVADEFLIAHDQSAITHIVFTEP
jgi:hypothetical protein